MLGDLTQAFGLGCDVTGLRPSDVSGGGRYPGLCPGLVYFGPLALEWVLGRQLIWGAAFHGVIGYAEDTGVSPLRQT